MKSISIIGLCLTILGAPQSVFGDLIPPTSKSLGQRLKPSSLDWQSTDTWPSTTLVYRCGPRPLPAALGDLSELAASHGMTPVAALPEFLGKMGTGAYAYELQDFTSPRSLYYQPLTGSFLLTIDSSAGFSTFEERFQENWPKLPCEEEAYALALARFGEFGLNKEDFFQQKDGRIYTTKSHHALDWFDPEKNARRHENTTISLKFYRRVGELRVGSSSEAGCAIFQYGPRHALMAVDWRLREAYPYKEYVLMDESGLRQAVLTGKGFSGKSSADAQAWVVEKVELLAHEGGQEDQTHFYPLFSLTCRIKGSESEKTFKVSVPALVD
jgi:hypothetical protein